MGAYEVKTHLSRLLDEVSEGTHVTITKHGTPIAYLIPAEKNKQSTEEIIEDLQRMSKQISLGGLTIQELREEGRR